MERQLSELNRETPSGPVRRGTGAWSWIAQRLTGAFLIFFLGAHFWLLHFDITGQRILFDRVAARLASPFFVFLDVGLLAVVLYHALNGARNVIMDLSFGPKIDKPLSYSFLVIGIIALIYGINALLPFTTGQAFLTR